MKQMRKWFGTLLVAQLVLSLSLVVSVASQGRIALADELMGSVDDADVSGIVDSMELEVVEEEEEAELAEAEPAEAPDVELVEELASEPADEPADEPAATQEPAEEAVQQLGEDEAIASTATSWSVSKVVLPSTSARYGEYFNAKAYISGTAEGVTWKFTWNRNNIQNSKNNGTIAGSATSATRTCRFRGVGLYTITATATDKDGVSNSASKKIYVYDLEGATLTGSNGSYMLKPDMGVTPDYLKGLQYRYTWKNTSTGKTGVIKDWSWQYWCAFKSGSLKTGSGKIEVFVEARDAKGSIGKVSKSYTNEWKLTAVKLPAVSMRMGEYFKAYAVTSGSTDGLTYKFTWNRNNIQNSKNNGTIAGDADSSERTCRFRGAGTYTITVTATDSSGKSMTASKKIYVYDLKAVKLGWQNGRYMAKPDLGCPTTYLKGIQYRYLWRVPGTSRSGVIKDWSKETWCSFTKTKYAYAGKMEVVIEARDANGNFGQVSKSYNPDDMTIKAQYYSSPTNMLVMVDETNCWVGIYQRNNGNWERIKYWRCSCGRNGATPHGDFYITGRGYSFDGADFTCYWYTDYYLGTYAFHSVIYSYHGDRVLDGRLGYHISAGCIRLAYDNARWLNQNVPYYTRCIIY